MKLLRVFPLLFLGSILIMALAQAKEPLDCPKSLAIIEIDKFSEVPQIMVDLQKMLGCRVELKVLPIIATSALAVIGPIPGI